MPAVIKQERAVNTDCYIFSPRKTINHIVSQQGGRKSACRKARYKQRVRLSDILLDLFHISGVIAVSCVIHSLFSLISSRACVKIASCIGYYYKAPVLKRIILRRVADATLCDKVLCRHIGRIELFATFGSLRSNAYTAAEEIHDHLVFRTLAEDAVPFAAVRGLCTVHLDLIPLANLRLALEFRKCFEKC